MRLSRHLAIAFVAVAASLTVACVPVPPALQAPQDPPPSPTVPTTAPSPSPTTTTDPTEPDPQPTQIPDTGELPAHLPLDEQLPGGYLSGWQSSLTPGDGRFEALDDHDFPTGPTISVIDTETSCAIWAYNSIYDSGTDDLTATVDLLIEVTSQESNSSFDMEPLDFGPNPTQGITVEFGVLESTDDRGTWAARVYGSIASAQYVQVVCGTPEEELALLEEVASELLIPDFL